MTKIVIMNESHYKVDVGLKRRRFSLWEIYNAVLDEVFDFNRVDIYNLKDRHDGWEFEAEINGELVTVYIYVEEASSERFKMIDKFNGATEIFNFGFEVGQDRITKQYAKTNYRDYLRIIATVGNALTNFIHHKTPDIVTLFSESKHGGTGVDVQKDDVYFSALNRNKIAGYDLESVRDIVDSKNGIMLYNVNRFKEHSK